MKFSRLTILIVMLLGMLIPSVVSADSAAVTRIQFAPGATSAYIPAQAIVANAIHEYVIRAMKGQQMTVNLSAYAGGSVFLTIYGVNDGQPLVRAAMGQTSWTGILPATQDYMIMAVNTGGATTYNLEVIIPARIRFAPGGISATVNGKVGPSQRINYILSARQGQTMTVSVVTPNNDASLTIYGADGIPLKRYEAGGGYWSGVLPLTQDYNIVVVSLNGNNFVNYTLSVTIV